MANVETSVSDLLQECLSLWWDSDSSFPDLGPSVSRHEQIENGRALARVVDQVLAEVKRPPGDPQARESAARRLGSASREFVKMTIGLDDVHLDALEHGGFFECGRAFVDRVRQFDPALSAEDTFQASRNVWTMNGIQRMLGQPARLTPSVFAYSLLYPYTDNALDRPTLPHEKKLRLSDRLGQRLRGNAVAPETADEDKLFRLIAEIEREYPRETAAAVYESLYAIHAAQERSVGLLQRDVPPYDSDILGIALEKGGTSVLADGYLVAGTVAPDLARLWFGLGALLQLADDLQDVEDDRAKGLATVFSQTAKRWPLDRLVTRLFAFRIRILERLACLTAPEAAPLADLMRKSTLHLILHAAADAPRFFSRVYLRSLEAHSPFGLRDLARERRRLERERLSVFALLASAAAPSSPASGTSQPT